MTLRKTNKNRRKIESLELCKSKSIKERVRRMLRRKLAREFEEYEKTIGDDENDE